MTHNSTIMQRIAHDTHYVGKGYKSRFECPACQRSCWQHLSFLGTRRMVCDGEKFYKVARDKAVIAQELATISQVGLPQRG